jgi:hypothetical protein
VIWHWSDYDRYRTDGLTEYHKLLRIARLLRPITFSRITVGPGAYETWKTICLSRQISETHVEYIEVVW